MQSTTHGIGIIGLGMAIEPHARALEDLAGRAPVIAACAPSAERRAQFAERHAFPLVDEVAPILEDPRIDTVLLATPPNARLDLVKALVAAGKNILMEKPAGRTTREAARIVEMCELAGVTLGFVFQHRFREASLELARRLHDDALGRIEMVHLTVPWWRPQRYYDEPGRGSYERDGGGVLISQAIHGLDLMLALAGPVAEVAAIAGTTGLHRMESEDFVGAGLSFGNGALGALMATTARYPGFPERLEIAGSKGGARLEAGRLALHFLDGRFEQFGEETSTGGGADPMAFPHDWHRGVWEDFLDALDEGRAPAAGGRDVLRVHRLIDALMRSSKERRHVELKEV
ncbi:MAG: Gfo/Idh/MocA family oxidoreductase [Geminicoccaceae bacterium]|nr:Gfo/Idh/MocA family oxidoreductase [Geminicoccaceae bacterium]